MNKPNQIKIKYQEPVESYISSIGGTIKITNQPQATITLYKMNFISRLAWHIIDECKFRTTKYKAL